jgi:hypothetical protein
MTRERHSGMQQQLQARDVNHEVVYKAAALFVRAIVVCTG